MARKTKEEALETRNNILDAAANVFFDKGVHSTSLEDIAAAAGVTRGAIYWHFKNKLDIFSALHTRLHTSYIDILRETIKSSGEKPLEDIENFCVEMLKRLEDEPATRRMLTIFMRKCDYSGELEPFAKMQNEEKRNALPLTGHFFEEAIKKGQLPKGTDTMMLSMTLMCFMSGIVYEYIRMPGLINLKTAARPMMRRFFSGLGAEV